MKLHLGCGPKFIPGFVHVDLLDAEHIDFNVPVDQLDFAPDASVALIYASHVLEHFGRREFNRALVEWYRVLKPGGVLRIAVPDFKAVVEYYTNGGDISDVLGLVCGGQKDQYDFHAMIFDETSLSAALKAVGFTRVNRYDWRQTEHASIDDFSQAYLPHMDKKNGKLMSLNLEATK